jgi:hypothetical protein
MLAKMKGLSFWRVFLVVVVLAGTAAYIVDRVRGYPFHLYEVFPWDISATLNIFCGLSLAAAGMTIAAVLAVLELSEYRLLRTTSLVIAYLGFVCALIASILRYRLDWNTVWSLWSPHSIPAGAGVALVLYSVILLDDIYSARRNRPGSEFVRLPAVRYVAMLLTCIAAFVAGLQESAFLNVMAVAPDRFSPIWVSAMLPVNAFLSGVSACLALMVFSFWRFGSSTSKVAEPLTVAAIALRVVLIVTIGMRILELTDMHQWHNLASNHLCGYLFGLELVLFLTPALFLLNARKGEYRLVSESSLMVIAGFVTNRLNTTITSREIVTGTSFEPRFSDMIFALALIALATAAFVYTMKRRLESHA